MNKKYLLILLLVLLGLLGLLAAQRISRDKTSAQSASLVELQPGISQEQVNKIQISANGMKLVLQKDGDVWNMAAEDASESAQANTAQVQDLLGVLDGVPVELVSKNTQRQETLGITDEKASSIVYMNGDQELYTLLVSSTNNQLIRQKGRENVYRWGTTFSRMVTADTSMWAEPVVEATPSGEMVTE